MSNIIPEKSINFSVYLNGRDLLGVGLVAEERRETIIPLESQKRGMSLWIEAGRELGLLSGNVSSSVNIPEISVKPSERGVVGLLNSLNTENTVQSYYAVPSVINALKIADGGIE